MKNTNQVLVQELKKRDMTIKLNANTVIAFHNSDPSSMKFGFSIIDDSILVAMVGWPAIEKETDFRHLEDFANLANLNLGFGKWTACPVKGIVKLQVHSVFEKGVLRPALVHDLVDLLDVTMMKYLPCFARVMLRLESAEVALAAVESTGPVFPDPDYRWEDGPPAR